MQASQQEPQASKYRKRILLLVAYALLLSPWIVSGAMNALQSNANSPLDWVDDRFAPRQQYDRFSSQFGTADAVVISWPQCQVDDPRLDTFVRALRQGRGFQGESGSFFHHITSGREALATLTGPPLSLSADEATRRLRGSLIGPDGKTTSVVIGFSESGLKQRSRLVPLIRQAALRYCDAAYETQHLAGPIMDGYSVDRASQSTMSRFAPLASIIAFCICLLCLDSLIAACLVFGISLVCQGVALAVLHFGGGEMTALLIVLPPLIQLLAIAGGVHFVNYYFDCATSTSPAKAVENAFRIAWLPCVLSAATTAIGLGSLAVSGLVAVREFGTYAAIGVVATVAVLLSFLPGAISWFPPRLPPSRSRPGQSAGWVALTNWQQRYGGRLSLAALVLMVGLGIGVSRLEASVRIETLFGSGSQLLDDYAWIEQHVGSTVPIEVVAHFPRNAHLSAAQQFGILENINVALRQVMHVDSVTSPLDFMPAVANQDRAMGSYFLQSSKPMIQQINYFSRSSDGVESWRTTAYTSALGDTNYVSILNQLDIAIGQALTTEDRRAGAHIETSGLMPLVHEIQHRLLLDLFASFLTAFVLIAAVMTIVQAGVSAGLLSMIPNVFPALALFGFLGWTGHPIDIGSIMTASVAMGIAVDDTLHFLTFFQRELDAGRSRRDAVLGAYAHCGRAMIQTTLICGGGFAIFALSDFVPTARFAWMMILLLGAALIGDLLVLPALLLGPCGRQFQQLRDSTDALEADFERRFDPPVPMVPPGHRQRSPGTQTAPLSNRCQLVNSFFPRAGQILTNWHQASGLKQRSEKPRFS